MTIKATGSELILDWEGSDGQFIRYNAFMTLRIDVKAERRKLSQEGEPGVRLFCPELPQVGEVHFDSMKEAYDYRDEMAQALAAHLEATLGDPKKLQIPKLSKGDDND